MFIVLVLRVFIPFGLGYFLASTFRSINTVISTDLVRALSLSASELGFAGSAFFLSATLFQIPYGILLDRYDPRRIYASFLLLCALVAGGSLVVLFVTPLKRTTSTGITLLQQVLGLRVILQSIKFWRLTPLLMIVVCVYAGFPALWDGPWVSDVSGFNDVEAANLLFLMAGAITVFGFLIFLMTF
jgi:MFS family permease